MAKPNRIPGTRIAILAAALLLAVVVWRLAAPSGPPRIRARLSLSEVLSATATDADPAPDGFARAVESRTFTFPADHGPHPDFQTEWWYFTGNLESRDGHAFGYQLTFFRQALQAHPPPRASAWATSEIFMGHLGLTDIAAGNFHSHERFSRAAVGLAGAQADPLHVWIDDWSLRGGGDGEPFSLEATAGEVSLRLTLEPATPVVLQGDLGLSHKGGAAGNASYYYSIPRLRTFGTLRVDGAEYTVHGLSWMDREWSTSALGPDLAGWDWFALQLDDGSDLMFYRLRRQDGSVDPASAGSLVSADGSRRSLSADDIEIEVTATWRSPHSDATYPAAWTLHLPDGSLDLRLEPRLADQEHDLSVLYWEGAVQAEGTRGGRPVSGHGYVELTGYGSSE